MFYKMAAKIVPLDNSFQENYCSHALLQALLFTRPADDDDPTVTHRKADQKVHNGVPYAPSTVSTMEAT